jgi:hypothetical protein
MERPVTTRGVKIMPLRFIMTMMKFTNSLNSKTNQVQITALIHVSSSLISSTALCFKF